MIREACKAFPRRREISFTCISVKNFPYIVSSNPTCVRVLVGTHALSVLARVGNVPASAWLGFMYPFSLPKHHLN